MRLANQLVDLFHNGDEQGEYKIRIKVDPLIWGIVFEKTKRNEAIKMNASLVYHVEGRDDIEKRLVLASDKFLESMDILREKKSGFGDSEKQVMLSLFANFCEGDTTKCHGGLLPCWLLLLASWGYITRKKRLDLLSAIEKDRVTKKDEKDIIVECIMDVLDDILAVKTPLLAEFVESKKCAKADIEGHLG